MIRSGRKLSLAWRTRTLQEFPVETNGCLQPLPISSLSCWHGGSRSHLPHELLCPTLPLAYSNSQLSLKWVLWKHEPSDFFFSFPVVGIMIQAACTAKQRPHTKLHLSIFLIYNWLIDSLIDWLCEAGSSDVGLESVLKIDWPLAHRDLPASALWVLGLQAWIIMTVIFYFWCLETGFLCTALTVPKQAGSEPAIASWVLGLKVHTNMLCNLFCLLNKAQLLIIFLFLNHFSMVLAFRSRDSQFYQFGKFSDITSPNILNCNHILLV